VKTKGGGANDYVYVIIQPQVWAPLAKVMGREELVTDPAYATPEARLPHLDDVFGVVEQWTKTIRNSKSSKLNAIDVPCGPILSTQDIIDDPSLNASGMIATVAHPERGAFKTVGCPLVLSDTPVSIVASPLLGEHSEEILREIGHNGASVQELKPPAFYRSVSCY
jgi:formyl-CoA transferase